MEQYPASRDCNNSVLFVTFVDPIKHICFSGYFNFHSFLVVVISIKNINSHMKVFFYKIFVVKYSMPKFKRSPIWKLQILYQTQWMVIWLIRTFLFGFIKVPHQLMLLSWTKWELKFESWDSCSFDTCLGSKLHAETNVSNVLPLTKLLPFRIFHIFIFNNEAKLSPWETFWKQSTWNYQTIVLI